VLSLRHYAEQVGIPCPEQLFFKSLTYDGYAPWGCGAPVPWNLPSSDSEGDWMPQRTGPYWFGRSEAMLTWMFDRLFVAQAPDVRPDPDSDDFIADEARLLFEIEAWHKDKSLVLNVILDSLNHAVDSPHVSRGMKSYVGSLGFCSLSISPDVRRSGLQDIQVGEGPDVSHHADRALFKAAQALVEACQEAINDSPFRIRRAGESLMWSSYAFAKTPDWWEAAADRIAVEAAQRHQTQILLGHIEPMLVERLQWWSRRPACTAGDVFKNQL
jgi:hypothetical protein